MLNKTPDFVASNAGQERTPCDYLLVQMATRKQKRRLSFACSNTRQGWLLLLAWERALFAPLVY